MLKKPIKALFKYDKKCYNISTSMLRESYYHMVRILSDSTCDLSPELVERYHISVLPLNILLGDAEYQDGVNINPDQIFTWSDANKTTPKTSAPSVDGAMDLLKTYLNQGDEIVFFCISEKFSTCANVIRMVVGSLDAEDKVTVVDSMNLSTGIGLLVIEAAIMAEAGHTRAEIQQHIEKLRPLVRASFVVDTLVYLYRGGRCSGLAAMAGSMLKLHPEIVVRDGAMMPAKKYRGKLDSIILHYAKDMEAELLSARTDRVFITHSGCDKAVVDSVRSYLESLNHFDEILETRAGGVISSHCGPGTLGILFIAEA